MRRLASLAVLLLLAASVPLQAQRGGGGHASAGGHGGFSGHASFGAHSSGSFAGSHTGSAFASRSSARSFSRPLSSRALNSRNFNRSGNLRIRTFPRRNNCFGFRCGFGFGYPYLYGGIDPYWWDSDSSYDQDQQDQIGLANEMNAQSLDEQRMRDQNDQDIYARRDPPPPHQKERTDPDPATLLIFRDQHKLEIQNYAIVGQTLWNFSPQRTQKIPLSSLDLPATEKANEDRGVDFHLPNGNEGQ
jgi:hypothetical protein